MRKDIEITPGALQPFLFFPRSIPRGCWILLVFSIPPAIGPWVWELTPAAPPSQGRGM